MSEWRSTTVGEVLANIVAGHSPKTDGRAARPGEFGVLKLSAISWGAFQPAENKALPKSYRVRHELTVRAGDLLMSRANTVELVGAVVHADEAHPHLMLSDKTLRLEPRADLVDARFLMYALRTTEVRTAFEGDATGSSDSMRNLSQEKIRSAPLRLPPLPIQRRIVKKLDELLAQSRAARGQLEAVPDLVETYRQSVLAAAFRGDLSADWRKKNPNVEPASTLLERIRIERRKRWEEAELAKMKAKGTNPKDDKWKGKYVEPKPVEVSGLPELPETWCWASLDEVTLSHDGRRVPVKESDRRDRQGEFPYYGASGIIDHVNQFLFDGNFLLVAEDGANLLSRSTPIAFLGEGKFWVNNHAHVLESVVVRDEYLAAALNSTDLRQYVTGSAQPKLTQKNLQRLPIALSPLAEQSPMRETIKSALEGAAALLRAQPEVSEQVKFLERAVLAKAFRGELDLDSTVADVVPLSDVAKQTVEKANGGKRSTA